MKKMIRDRSIFVALASIIMAGVMLFCSARPASIRMPAEIRAIMGEQASTAFTAFFTELRDWYESYEVTEEGITLTLEKDYQATSEVFISVLDFLQAYDELKDPAQLETVNAFSEIFLTYLSEFVVILMYLEMEGEFPLTAEEWGNLGGSIDALESIYRSYQ